MVPGEAVSHRLRNCRHVHSAWSTEVRTNAAGDRTFVFQRICYLCNQVEEEMGAIIEPTPRYYARVQEVSDELDS